MLADIQELAAMRRRQGGADLALEDAIHLAMEQGKRIDTLTDQLLTRDRALKALLANPHGCVFCDSGKLRNPEKFHEDDCGFFLADFALKYR